MSNKLFSSMTFVLTVSSIAWLSACGQGATPFCDPATDPAQCESSTSSLGKGDNLNEGSDASIGTDSSLSGSDSSTGSNPTDESCDTGCLLGGSCMPGTSPSACGTGGNLCLICDAGQICLNGSCLEPGSTGGTSGCNASNCSGCCNANGKCVEFDQQYDQFCGNSGESCQQCASGQLCQHGVCGSGSKFGRWKVRVISAEVDSTLKWEKDGPNKDQPDLFVKVTLLATGEKKQTKVKENSFSATFDQDLFTVDEDVLTDWEGIQVQVKDEDDWGVNIGLGLPSVSDGEDDVIGTCNVAITPTKLWQKKLTLGPCSASQGEIDKQGDAAKEAVKSVVIEFIPE